MGGLPPQYWQAEESVTAKGVKEKFEAVAELTFGAFTLDGRTINFGDYYAQGGILKTPDDDTLNAMGRHLFPKTIAHTAGLMRAFHAQANPAAYAQAGKPDIPGGTTDAGVKKSIGSAAKERVELVGSTMIGNAEVKFIDASGKVTKTIKSGLKSVKKQGDKWLVEAERIQGVHGTLVLVNREKRFEDYDVAAHAEKCRNRTEYTEECAGGRETANPGEYWEKEVELFNARGETITKKMFRTYPQGTLVATSHWENELSRDGSHYYVYYRDGQGGGNIEIYDVSGKMLAHGRAEREIENIEISPDGSLAAGEVYLPVDEDAEKYIIVVDRRTGNAKLVQASGKIDGSKWIVWISLLTQIPSQSGYKNLPTGTVNLTWSFHEKRGAKEIVFDEIPVDLSIFLKQGGKR
jgi:hypothetical protein